MRQASKFVFLFVVGAALSCICNWQWFRLDFEEFWVWIVFFIFCLDLCCTWWHSLRQPYHLPWSLMIRRLFSCLYSTLPRSIVVSWLAMASNCNCKFLDRRLAMFKCTPIDRVRFLLNFFSQQLAISGNLWILSSSILLRRFFHKPICQLDHWDSWTWGHSLLDSIPDQ